LNEALAAVRPLTTARSGGVLALTWLLVVLAIALHQWHFWHQGRLDTDVLALLPEDEQAPEVAQATRVLAERASRQVVVMVGAHEWQQARRAAAAWRGALQQAGAPLQALPAPDAAGLSVALDFYRPWRDRLLTPAQRQRLEGAAPASLVPAALAALYQPGAGLRLSDWAADPLGLWPAWWQARAGETRARPRDGELSVSADGTEWVVMPFETTGAAFALDGNARHGDALRAAANAARGAVPGAQVLAAGIPLHAEAAAVQANREINTIGWGSLAAVLLLVWLAFRSLRPMLLVGLSLLVGTAAALSVTAAVFGSVHLITLVFGASLVGVAEDYGIHWFASRQGQPGVAPRSLMRQLLPGLALALATSVLAYLALGLAPFPGLRQMALFSASGLVAAFLTVLCWFPWLDRSRVPLTRFSSWLGGTLARWPRLGLSRRHAGLYAAVGAACVAGLWLLKTNDDVRQLQASPAALVQGQRDVGRLLGETGPVQFYLVRGSSAEQVLAREELLKNRLEPLVAEGALLGWRAVSDWVPSLERQQADAALTARAETQVLAGVNAALGENLQRPAFSAAGLTPERWLADPVSAPLRPVWLGEASPGMHASVVMLRGLHGSAQLPRLAAAAQGLEGVRWVDKTSDISSLLGRYRVSMGWLLLLGHAAVLLALAWRYGRSAWRAWLPTVIASIVTLAALGALQQPLQLFNVLALALLLGVGVDYGVFLLEHRGDGAAWVAVALGAASTWLAFGLLALSATPALRAFGLTLLIGLALVGVLAPALRAPPHTPPSSHLPP
jgi:predicted exporter